MAALITLLRLLVIVWAVQASIWILGYNGLFSGSAVVTLPMSKAMYMHQCSIGGNSKDKYMQYIKDK